MAIKSPVVWFFFLHEAKEILHADHFPAANSAFLSHILEEKNEHITGKCYKIKFTVFMGWVHIGGK